MSNPTFTESEILKSLNANNIYQKTQLDKYNKFSRFGYFDPYNSNTVTREYVFFTKTDLHLFKKNTQTLNPEIESIPFFIEAAKTHKDTMNQLQRIGSNPFANLLSNTAASKLDVGDIQIDTMETGATIAGTKMEYPLATTTSNNMQEFTLEFEETKNLDVYMFFRIWYEYELLKVAGSVTPPDQNYTINRIIHDQMSCYKIVVGEDFQTIEYYAKYWGVFPTTIPRSSFSDIQDGPLKIPVNFKCQWVEDMDPNILSDFNKVVSPILSKYSSDIPIYDSSNSMIDGRWANIPYIVSSTSNGRKVYKLKWR